jgi:adenylosuccinate synthase
LIVTTWHRLLGRIRELDRGDQRHGSTGQGVGETVRYARLFPDRALRVRHLAHSQEMKARLRELKAFAIDQAEQCALASEQGRALIGQMRDVMLFWEQCETCLTWRQSGVQCVESDANWRTLLGDEPLLFEGAQGVLLDPVYGFPPHVTKTDVTDRPLQALEQEWQLPRPVKRLGVLRGYATRHGAGPFPGEEKTFSLTETHNVENPWQGSMRFGWHHPELLRRSRAALLHLDGIAITCLDQLAGRSVRMVSEPGSFHWSHLAAKARFLEPDLRAFLDVFVRELRAPVRLLSFGPTFEDKRFLSSDFSPL